MRDGPPDIEEEFLIFINIKIIKIRPMPFEIGQGTKGRVMKIEMRKNKKTNKMKTNKLFYTLALIFMTSLGFGQTQFDKYEDMEGVTSVIVNQKAFSLMGKIGTESDQEYPNKYSNGRLFLESAQVGLFLDGFPCIRSVGDFLDDP